MEPTAVHEEETNASRPSGSIIQIKAISIDLMFAREMCAAIGHNFSIRGYVAEMRTKNPKACNPFSSDDFNGFKEQIPQNIDILSETHQDSAPLLNDVVKVPDSCLVAVADSEIAVNLDNVVKDVEEIAEIQVTGKENVVHEGIADDTDYVPPLLNEFKIAESSGLLPEEKMNSTNDEERTAETVNPVQNNEEVFVPEPVDSVLEVEKTNNELYDSDWSDECDPSYKFSRRKIKKLRLLSDLLGDKSSIRTDHVREEDNSTTGAETSRPHDQILDIDDVNRQMTSDAEPTVKRSVIPCSDSSLQRISNKTVCLKRKIERNQSSVRKKRKPSEVLDSSFPLSVTIRNDVSKRCSISSNISFGSSSSAGEPKNSSEPQILDRCQHRIGSSRKQDIDDIEIVLLKKKKKKKNIRFAEAFLRNKQALDPNERAYQEPSKLVNEPPNHRDGKAVVVQGSSDDVPMEIVELMAKNQYERTLGNNAGSHLFPFKTFNTMKIFPEFQDFRNSGSHYNMDQVEHSLSLFDSLTGRTGSQHVEVVGTSMLPRFGLGSVPESSSSHKGKTISDIKADELKKTHESRSLLNDPIGIELDHKLKGPIDPYSDEKIPALQLLSLMDDRSPCSTFNGGTSRIFENGFSNGSMFLHHNQGRESYDLGIGARNGEGCSRHLPFGSLSLESQMHERSREKTHIFGSISDVSNSAQSFYRGKDKQYSDDSQRITDQENITRLRTLPPIGICSLNRNPADFSIPEAGNVFTIDYRDIKVTKKRKCIKSRPLKSRVHVDSTNQQQRKITKKT